jgi:hypothetical protein
VEETVHDRRPGGGWVQRHPVASFVALTFVLTWSLWLLPLLEVHGYIRDAPDWWGLGSFGPSLAALILSLWIGGGREAGDLGRAVIRWRVPARWYATAVILPMGLALPALLVGGAGGAGLALSDLPGPAALLALFLQILFLGGPLNEELGWRGFALPRLQRRYGALGASLLVGTIWGVWHLPLFWLGAPGYTALPFGLYLLNTLALSVVFTWLFNGTRGSVLMAILVHATFNTTNWTLLQLLDEAAAERASLAYVLTIAAFALVLLLRYGPRSLSAEPEPVVHLSPAGDRA